jgi:hypothetical protein
LIAEAQAEQTQKPAGEPSEDASKRAESA